MCAIAGFIGLEQPLPQNSAAIIQSMLQCMQHRGPDGNAQHLDMQAQFALGHARLAIIAPDAQGQQPFFSADKKIVVLFNGEIYNYQALRQQLIALGYQFVSQTDTEVLLYAYREWGHDFLNHLDGMFAIALFDYQQDCWLLARDRIGAKPLYFSTQNGFLSFASQTNALLALPWIKNESNPLAFYHYLTFMSIPAPLTSVQQIYKLPAGFALTVDASKKLTFKQWYCPVQAVAKAQQLLPKLSQQDVVAQVKTLLLNSVKKRLVSDVPVAMFLSGGLDSSLVVALAAECGYKLTTFNICFADSLTGDERQWAKKVAQIFGCKHHEIVIEEHQINNLYREMQSACDQPLGDCVNLPLLAIANSCKAQGFKVALVGEGADEIFFGYPEYARQQTIAALFNNPLMQLLPIKLRQAIFWGAKQCNFKNGAQAILSHWQKQQPLFWGGAIAFHEHEKQALKEALALKTLMPDQLVAQIFPALKQTFNSGNYLNFFMDKINKYLPQADFAQQLALIELQHRLPDLLLTRVDSMTMAAGVEGREPLLDHQLIEFVLALPAHLRIPNNALKGLLKIIACDFLPQELVYRQKVGFGAPIDKWLNQDQISLKPTQNPKELMIKNAVQKWTLNMWKDK